MEVTYEQIPKLYERAVDLYKDMTTTVGEVVDEEEKMEDALRAAKAEMPY